MKVQCVTYYGVIPTKDVATMPVPEELVLRLARIFLNSLFIKTALSPYIEPTSWFRRGINKLTIKTL